MVDSVLVVDDDAAFLALAVRVLTELGIAVVLTAGDAAAAMREAKAARPAAALVDVDLPGRDGIDLAAELAALPWAPRVVLTSADRDAGRAVAALGEGTRPAFVPKEELAGETLRRLLDDE
jgi:CheY-like chemotaxis protein